ncbi:MAG: LysE family translocator [Pikeienuella sp.]
MTIETFLALFGLATAATWTPGPNNVMLTASGVNYGFRRTLPHIAGINTGFPVLIFLVALGLGEVFAASPALREGMRWGGAALLLWFAWKTATAGRASATTTARPLTFWQAVGFQWINPKGWTMALATAAQFVTGENPIIESGACALAYFATGLCSASVWASFGVGIRRALSTDMRLRIFNGIMGASLAGFAIFLFLS